MSGIKRDSIVLGITGGIACGKSEVGRILEGIGFAVCDADRVAHELLAPGSSVYQGVVDAFGEQVLTSDGEISRERLGRIVFENPDQLSLLNRLVHPMVRERLTQWISERQENHEDAAVQIPLLFESGMHDLGWDGIVCVSSPEAQVLERLEKRGIQGQEARRRIASQMALEKKEELSDRVIRNDRTFRELERAKREAVESLIDER